MASYEIAVRCYGKGHLHEQMIVSVERVLIAIL